MARGGTGETGLARVMAAALALALTAAPAGAVTVGGTWSVSGPALADPGLVVATSAPSGGFSLSLERGQSATLDLFRLWTPEAAVGADDRVARGLSVAFALEGGGAGTIAGTSAGHRGLGMAWGTLDWAAPLSLEVAGGGTLSIALDDTAFNAGFVKLAPGARFGSDVQATFSYVAPVPLPPAGALLLAALAASGLVRRRRT
jgi:MYXO-CTERM domain-containing protein